MLTSDIQQIEVLRGPQSGLYGADALGGVISIITKKGEGPPRATALHRRRLVRNLQSDRRPQRLRRIGFNYAFNVAHFRATDVPVTPLELLPPGQKAIGNNYDNMTYSTKLGADVSENLTLNAVARYTDATLRFTGDTFDPVTFRKLPRGRAEHANSASTQHARRGRLVGVRWPHQELLRRQLHQ